MSVSFALFTLLNILRQSHDGQPKYRGKNKGWLVLLSNSQAGPGRTVKQERKSRKNHVQTFIFPSVLQLKLQLSVAYLLILKSGHPVSRCPEVTRNILTARKSCNNAYAHVPWRHRDARRRRRRCRRRDAQTRRTPKLVLGSPTNMVARWL